MAALLRVVEGQAAGHDLALEGDLVVGRGEGGMGNLAGDSEISRQHARFRRLADGRILVEDLGSTNGTLVNGRRIDAPQILSPGDRIRVGATTMQLEVPEAAAAAAPAAPAAPAVAAGAAPLGPLPSAVHKKGPAAVTDREAPPRRRLFLGLAAFLVLLIGVGVGLIVKGNSGKTQTVSATASTGGPPSTSNFSCAALDNGKPGPGHFRFITSGCENAGSLVAKFPLQQGTSGGKTVWYVVTDSSSKADALARHVNFAPKLANAIGTPGVQNVTMKNGVIDFPATVDFRPQRTIVPGPNGFPPAKATPPSVGAAGYSPFIKLPNGIVINAPQIANDSGHADKALKIDTGAKTVLYQETEGRYEDKHVHYASFESGNPVAATIEDVTYAPALNTVPKPGDVGLKTSAREELVAFVNGPTGLSNPGRQGINSTIVDNADPHNILKEVPVLPLHPDVGDPKYAPAWDVHLAQWTPEAVTSGARVEVQSTDEVDQRVTDKLVTAPGGKKFGPSGFTVNCPLISIDIP
jgi:FHA domain